MPWSARVRARRPRLLALDRLLEIRLERLAQGRQVGAAGRENALAVGIVHERVEQVLERQVGVPARDCFAERDGEHDFKRM